MAPVDAVRRLERSLDDAGVPVAAVYLPHTDHMFDLVAFRWSPAARTAIHTLDRFLALVAVGAERFAQQPAKEGHRP
jgi:acetyl esterase/lipase